MRAILMAAGIGSRLSEKPMRPKCLWDLGGEPLIERTVRILTQHGVDVHIVIGFKHRMIEEALKDDPVTFHYNPFFRLTNSIASLWFAKDALTGGEDVILGNADVFWQESLLDLLCAQDEPVVMLGDVQRVESGDYFFQTDENGYLLDYGKRMPLEKRSCEYVGLCRIRKDFVPGFLERLERMIDEEQYDLWWENVLYAHCREYPVFVQDVGGRFWGEIDYLQDYLRIAEYVDAHPTDN